MIAHMLDIVRPDVLGVAPSTSSSSASCRAAERMAHRSVGVVYFFLYYFIFVDDPPLQLQDAGPRRLIDRNSADYPGAARRGGSSVRRGKHPAPRARRSHAASAAEEHHFRRLLRDAPSLLGRGFLGVNEKRRGDGRPVGASSSRARACRSSMARRFAVIRQTAETYLETAPTSSRKRRPLQRPAGKSCRKSWQML